MPHTATAPQIETFTGTLTPSSLNATDRTIDVCWYTGASVPRVDRASGEGYMLSLDPNGCRLDRLNSGSPVFDSHLTGDDYASALAGRIGMRAQAGVVLKAWVRDGRCYATLKFDTPEDSKDDVIWPKIQSGIARNLSFGAWIYTRELAKPEESNAGASNNEYIARDWEPFELSVVTVPADYQTEFLQAATAATTGVSMPQQQQPTGAAAGAASSPDRITMVSDIRKLGKIQGLDGAFVEQLCATAPDMATARIQILNHLADESDKHPTIPANSGGFRDERDNLAIRMAEAVSTRFTGKPPSEPAREFVGRPIWDLARECCVRNGVRLASHQPEYIVRMAMGTSDFPQLLTGTGERLLLDSYNAHQGVLKKVARRSTATDFRSKYRLRISEMPSLLKVAEHGEVHYGSRSESVESYAVETFARIFAVTRQALINDDLGALADSAAAFGRAAAAKEAEVLVALLSANAGMGATMTDTLPLFDLAHANLETGAGSALGLTGLSNARLALRTQTGLDGETILEVDPMYVIVPAALETMCNQLVTSITPALYTSVNPFVNLTPLVEPRLDAISTAAWYLSGSPSQAPWLEFSYLGDAQGPVVESRPGWDVLGIEYRAVLDFGCGVIGHRGVVLSVGS